MMKTCFLGGLSSCDLSVVSRDIQSISQPKRGQDFKFRENVVDSEITDHSLLIYAPLLIHIPSSIPFIHPFIKFTPPPPHPWISPWVLLQICYVRCPFQSTTTNPLRCGISRSISSVRSATPYPGKGRDVDKSSLFLRLVSQPELMLTALRLLLSIRCAVIQNSLLINQAIIYISILSSKNLSFV